MPLLKSIAISGDTQILIWKITESYNDLFRGVVLNDFSMARLEKMKSESHQRGFLGVRRLLMEAGYTDLDLYYDELGKPHLNDGRYISISHSHDFSVIALSDKIIGIDLEKIREKILKITPKYMDVSHLDDLSEGEQLRKATVVWGVKESVFKIKNEKGISFPQHIFESNFVLEDKKCEAELRFNNKTECFEVLFDFFDDYVFVCAFEKGK